MFTSNRLVICLGVLLSVATVAAQGPQLRLPARFSAFAVSAGGATTSAVASQFEVTIDRWSTTAETQRLMTVLKDKGADALLESLRDQKSVGSIRTPGNLAYDLRFASTQPGEDGGHRIFLATDRPISFWEAVNRPRTIDYPFTFIELRLNKNGEGEGKLALATKIDLSRDGKTLELVNYDSQPIQLNQVRRR